ncbi:MAG: RNHCP domain-containing protein [Acidimicrobiia bacterium]
MIEDARFVRRTEDFACVQCGTTVHGDGYTNHCPRCLWSLHVDVNPGDRAADCGGPMQPVGIEQRGGEWRVVQRCTQCGHRRPNRISDADDPQVVRAIAANPLLD